ncbi:MAG: fructose system component [Verrucomicrobiota bacterium]|jgi:mannitol/fructose-specific phosphotransferase system IIA component (Ntr-type)
MAIVLADVVDVKHLDLSLRARTQENAFRQLIGLLAATEQVIDSDKFLAEILERERVNPSVVEHGVAFPHARTDLVQEIVLAIGRSRAGVPIGAEGRRAQLIFLIGVPKRLVSDYLVCVGALARLAKDDDVRAKLLTAVTAEEFANILRPPT